MLVSAKIPAGTNRAIKNSGELAHVPHSAEDTSICSLIGGERRETVFCEVLAWQAFAWLSPVCSEVLSWAAWSVVYKGWPLHIFGRNVCSLHHLRLAVQSGKRGATCHRTGSKYKECNKITHFCHILLHAVLILDLASAFVPASLNMSSFVKLAHL